MARQRIVPAIPHQLSIRRAKVVPAGKNDQQPADDKAKSASLLANADKQEVSTSTNGIEDANAHQRDENAVLLNGAKDEQAKQVVAKEEPVATKELAVNKEPLEKEKPFENKEDLPAEKEVVVEKKTKEVNGKLYLPHVSYKMLSDKWEWLHLPLAVNLTIKTLKLSHSSPSISTTSTANPSFLAVSKTHPAPHLPPCRTRPS